MQNEELQKRIEKLKRQVARYEAKGYAADTAAHQVLDNLLKQAKSAEGVIPRNARMSAKEDSDGE